MPTKTFDKNSTAEEVLAGIDLKGKRALVTGCSAGIGVETARALAAHGAYVVGAVRDIEKAKKNTEAVKADAKNGGGIEFVELDLSSLESARRCADELIAKGEKFNLVIANAGIMACPKSFTKDGFEMQFGTNHLGHFVFINRIASLFNANARLVNLSSAGHRFAEVDLQDPNFEKTEYTEFGAYGRSKTANILFAVEFDRRHKDKGIRATAVHPGVIKTELGRHMPPGSMDNLEKQIKETDPTFEFKSIEQGAATSLWAGVTAPAEAVGANYCEDCHVGEVKDVGVDPSVRGGVRKYAVDPDNAKALWAKSEEMVGEKYLISDTILQMLYSPMACCNSIIAMCD
jgi:NAD(P)-dependent dehydrogenase (short-subunit alcohol dehydrogenase family)